MGIAPLLVRAICVLGVVFNDLYELRIYEFPLSATVYALGCGGLRRRPRELSDLVLFPSLWAVMALGGGRSLPVGLECYLCFWGSGLLLDQPVRGAGYEPSGIIDTQESQ